MSNTITNTQIRSGNRRIVQYFTLLSDGTQETATTVYSSGTTATTIGVLDPKTCAIIDVKFTSSSPVGKIQLLWKASTNVVAFSLPYAGNHANFCFRDIGGLPNQGAAGKTGDIVITTTGLVSGDTLSLILEVRPD